MLYNNNVLKQPETEYGQSESNKISQEQVVGECGSVQLETFTTYQNKGIKVVLEFPKESDKKAESEFIDMLKGIYLNKIQIGSMQSDSEAVQSLSTDNTIAMSNTKEDKHHE